MENDHVESPRCGTETLRHMMQAERQETIANIGEDLFAIAVDQPFRSLFINNPLHIFLHLPHHCHDVALLMEDRSIVQHQG